MSTPFLKKIYQLIFMNKKPPLARGVKRLLQYPILENRKSNLSHLLNMSSGFCDDSYLELGNLTYSTVDKSMSLL